MAIEKTGTIIVDLLKGVAKFKQSATFFTYDNNITKFDLEFDDNSNVDLTTVEKISAAFFVTQGSRQIIKIENFVITDLAEEQKPYIVYPKWLKNYTGSVKVHIGVQYIDDDKAVEGGVFQFSINESAVDGSSAIIEILQSSASDALTVTSGLKALSEVITKKMNDRLDKFETTATNTEKAFSDLEVSVTEKADGIDAVLSTATTTVNDKVSTFTKFVDDKQTGVTTALQSIDSSITDANSELTKMDTKVANINSLLEGILGA